jgi:hydroxymethylbilane synthase
MADIRSINIGTRESKLAGAQANQVKNLILETNRDYQNNPDLISIITFKTTGDQILDKNLSDIGGKGLFTKEIEEALIERKIDIAVHSMKDMPALSPEGLDIFAIVKREDARDAFISKKYQSIKDLPNGAVVGTSSSRRKSLLLQLRPDLKIVNFRGNVTTRLAKIDDGQVDATILAVAGLKRIHKEEYIRSIISTSEILPAVAQGAIGVQARNNDEFIINLVRKINDSTSETCVKAERAFLKIMDGSCKTPMAAFCENKNGKLHLKALICSPDGKEIYQTSRTGSLDEAEQIGIEAGFEIKKNAKNILSQIE